ncbi:hypothetical protein TNCV_876001 [Trichonephila clavipes]|nr:hypothetical protein TNCV_876001 [Trichonephila clavipes]
MRNSNSLRRLNGRGLLAFEMEDFPIINRSSCAAEQFHSDARSSSRQTIDGFVCNGLISLEPGKLIGTKLSSNESRFNLWGHDDRIRVRRYAEENPQESISEIVKKVHELTGVSERTVFRLKKETKTVSALSSPGKKRRGGVGQRRRLVKYDAFTLSCKKSMAFSGIDKVSTQNWAKCINHVIKKEKEMWEIDGLVDEIWENQNFIISVNSDSSHSDSERMSADDL